MLWAENKHLVDVCYDYHRGMNRGKLKPHVIDWLKENAPSHEIVEWSNHVGVFFPDEDEAMMFRLAFTFECTIL